MRIPDRHLFEEWLRERANVPDVRVRDIQAVEGGASNLTCRVELDDAPWEAVCLRLQQERGIFEPYDVLREGTVIRALEDSEIPVPRVYGWEASKRWLGARFLVMEWIDAPHMGAAGPDASFEAFVEMVARIHRVDWRDTGLGFLGVPKDAAAGVRAEIEEIARRMVAFGCGANPVLAEAARILMAAAPSDGRAALCHGDINVFNYLFRRGEVVGVVDWERARIGDPRSDIGQLVALTHLKGSAFIDVRDTPFVRMYQAAAGEELTAMPYFRARWLYELAVIYNGWVSFNASAPWYSEENVMRLLEMALDEVR